MEVYQWYRVADEWRLGTELIAGNTILLSDRAICHEWDEIGHKVYPPSDRIRMTAELVPVIRTLPPKVEKRGEPVIIADPCFISSERPADCGVVCLANLLQLSYEKARLLAFQHGWSSTSGLERGWVQKIMEDHGFFACYCPEYNHADLTSIKLPTGLYSVYVQRHVMPVVNGEVLNVNGSTFAEEVTEYRLPS